MKRRCTHFTNCTGKSFNYSTVFPLEMKLHTRCSHPNYSDYNFAHYLSERKLGMKKVIPSLGNRKSPKLFPLKWDYMMEYMYVEYSQTETEINWNIQSLV